MRIQHWQEKSVLSAYIVRFYPHDITKEELQKLPNVKGVILFGGEHRNVDGKDIDVLPEIYDAGYSVMAIDHAPALCEMKLASMPTEEQLRGFVFDTCKADTNWNMKNFVADQIELIKEQVGDRKVLLALSGGVDSSVVAALLIKSHRQAARLRSRQPRPYAKRGVRERHRGVQEPDGRQPGLC